jgi:hypothetical protein
VKWVLRLLTITEAREATEIPSPEMTLEAAVTERDINYLELTRYAVDEDRIEVFGIRDDDAAMAGRYIRASRCIGRTGAMIGRRWGGVVAGGGR